jgi:hypothetical protein
MKIWLSKKGDDNAPARYRLDDTLAGTRLNHTDSLSFRGRWCKASEVFSLAVKGGQRPILCPRDILSYLSGDGMIPVQDKDGFVFRECIVRVGNEIQEERLEFLLPASWVVNEFLPLCRGEKVPTVRHSTRKKSA